MIKLTLVQGEPVLDASEKNQDSPELYDYEEAAEENIKEEELVESGYYTAPSYAIITSVRFESEVKGDPWAARFDPVFTKEIEQYKKQKPSLALYNDDILGSQIFGTAPLPRTRSSNEYSVLIYLLEPNNCR
jgi:hypothetical protein